MRGVERNSPPLAGWGNSISNGDQVSSTLGAHVEGQGEVRRATPRDEEWELAYPHQIVDEDWLEGATVLHEAASTLCKLWFQELGGASLDSEGLSGLAVNKLRSALQEQYWCVSDGVVPVVGSLAAEVALGDDEPPAVEQFLQTRRELESWRQGGEDEVEALECTAGAVESVTAEQVDQRVKNGKKVVQVPGKAVLTWKSGIGKRRLRCCGNFLPASELNASKQNLYAGGVDALTFRVVLAYVSQLSMWEACLLDIKTAFLNAPVRGGGSVEGGNEPLIVVRPSFVLVQLVQTSSRDWAVHRDSVLKGIKLDEPVAASLIPKTHFIFSKGILGDWKRWWLSTDDIALFGLREVLVALVDVVPSVWTISGPNWAAPGSRLKFRGGR